MTLVLGCALAGGMALAVLAPGLARAAEPANGAAARGYAIAAGDLGAVLAEFAAASGVQLVFDPQWLAGRGSDGLQGRYGVADGFARLLAGSGYEAVAAGSGRYVLQAAAGADPEPTAALPAVTVTAQGMGNGSTEGTGSYAADSSSAATGLRLSLRETPQSVSVVTRQQIEDQGYTSARDALDSVTGVYGSDWDTKRTFYYARGFAVDRVSYDGVVSNDSGGSNYGENAQDLAFYDRVEVVRGATGLLTGAGEPSATINYVRKRADSRTVRGHASASLGSWNDRHGEVDLSTPLTRDGRVRARLVAVAQQRESFLDFYRNTKPALYGTVEADLTPQTRLSVGADYARDEIDGATWGGLPVIFSDGSRTNWPRSRNEGARWPYWNSRSTSAFADLEHRFDNGWNLRGNLTYRKKDYQTQLLLPYDLYGTGLDRQTGAGLAAYSWASDDTHRQASGSLQASGPFALLGREHELIVGYNGSTRRTQTHGSRFAIEDIANYYDWDGSYPEPAWEDSPDDPATRTRENALYAAARLSLADPLHLIVGGRYTDWRSTVGAGTRSHAEFAPYVGVVLDLGAAHSLYASYTEIFSPQDRRDVSGNYLDPATGINYEIGLKGDYLDGRLQASLALFRTLQDGVATADGVNRVPGTAEQAYVAADGVKSRGVEAELSGQPLPGWNLSAGISRVLSRDADGSAFNPYMPGTLFKLGTSYRLPGAWHRLTVGGSLVWQNATYDDVAFPAIGRSHRHGQGSFAVVGLMARYALTPQWSLQVNVSNLFDRTYWAYYASNSGTYGAPRRWYATLEYRF